MGAVTAVGGYPPGRPPQEQGLPIPAASPPRCQTRPAAPSRGRCRGEAGGTPWVGPPPLPAARPRRRPQACAGEGARCRSPPGRRFHPPSPPRPPSSAAESSLRPAAPGPLADVPAALPGRRRRRWPPRCPPCRPAPAARDAPPAGTRRRRPPTGKAGVPRAPPARPRPLPAAVRGLGVSAPSGAGKGAKRRRGDPGPALPGAWGVAGRRCPRGRRWDTRRGES